jgi:hypothetical protein
MATAEAVVGDDPAHRVAHRDTAHSRHTGDPRLRSHQPETLDPLSGPAKLLAAFFHAAMTRTAGFNSLDMAALRPETLFTSDMLMFIGGGSAGTAGGLKVTTFGVLAMMV